MNKEKRKIYIPYIFVNISGTLMIAITYLVSKYPDTAGGLGGSFVFFLFIIGAIGFFYFIKTLSLELSFIPLIIAGIMGINFFGYLEITRGTLTTAYSWIFFGCFFGHYTGFYFYFSFY